MDLWTYYAQSLRADLREWVSGWPTELLDGPALLAHSWLERIGKGFIFQRLRSPENAASMFDASDFRFAFIGHSHQPGWWELGASRPQWTSASAGQRLDWAPDTRYIVDVGSLGEPYRPNDPRWVVWDDTGVTWCG